MSKVNRFAQQSRSYTQDVGLAKSVVGQTEELWASSPPSKQWNLSEREKQGWIDIGGIPRAEHEPKELNPFHFLAAVKLALKVQALQRTRSFQHILQHPLLDPPMSYRGVFRA